MNPEEVKMASGAQCSTLAQMVAVALVKKFDGNLTYDQCQKAITDKN